MEENKKCLSCAYLCLWEHDCTNISSERFARWVDNEDSCEFWEGEYEDES